MYVFVEGKRVFLTNQRHYPYATGNATELTGLSAWRPWIIVPLPAVYICIIVLIVLIAQANRQEQTSRELIFYLGAFIYFVANAIERTMNLIVTRWSKLIFGQIVEAKGRQELPDMYEINFTYEFISPSGRTIRNTGWVSYPSTTTPPSPGTPVAVLYLTDSFYRAI